MAAFLCSIMSDNDKLSWYLGVTKRMGIKILPPDVNESGREFSPVKGNAIRFGMAGIKSVGEQVIDGIIKARANGGRFTSILGFLQTCAFKADKQARYRKLNQLRRYGFLWRQTVAAACRL